ncbi:MAG TPA: DUF763 domain-containing protein, partial [Flavisolibacter sp.]|nr:DUF763 domain-containing protein [Flavisolibacter sp.]
MREVRRLVMPSRHQVDAVDIDLKRLGAMLWLAHDAGPENFESLLLLEGMGPRTLQSLALVSEVIHGTPSRFSDPARFSFAHGGKDGNPFPVPVNTYDEVIGTLQKVVQNAKMGQPDKAIALQKLHSMAVRAEEGFSPAADVQPVIDREWAESPKYGGRTILGPVAGKSKPADVQLRLF